MKEVIIGLVAALIGVALVFGGYKIARVLIPIWGFFVGFMMGAAGVADALNSGFIGTTLGIVVGLVMGAVFALLAYFFFSLSIVLLGGTLGYWLGTGMITALGFNKGFMSAAVGITIGVVLAIIFIIINAPKIYLILVTSVAGSAATIGGLLLIFKKIQLDSFAYAVSTNEISIPFFWAIALFALAIIGIVYQTISNNGQQIETWGTPFAKDEPKQIKAE